MHSLTSLTRTVRFRLTILYGTLFAVSGAVLLTITYLLVKHTTGRKVLFTRRTNRSGPFDPYAGLDEQMRLEIARAQDLVSQAEHQRAADLQNLLVQSGVALAIMVVLSIALGWLIAGRVLRPLRTMTTTVQQISARNIHERLALPGPRDELKDLADTVDGLLGRLETALEAHKRFVANAAHELRTPLTLERALMEETLTDRSATLDTYRSTFERLVGISDHQARLLEALLTLASSERGLDRRDPCELSALAERALLLIQPKISHLGLEVVAEFLHAPTSGDQALLERLVANLLDNAADYNVPGGRVEIATRTEGDCAVLRVTNTGPPIPPEQVDRLFEPFQRFKDRTARHDGHHGLGLSIVRAIAAAHGAFLAAQANPDGGLTVWLSFPCFPQRTQWQGPAQRQGPAFLPTA